MGKSLLDTFKPIDKSTWLDKVEKDLRGKPLEKLIHHHLETLEIQPLYHAEDIQHYSEGTPGHAPYLRGNKSKSNQWIIHQDIEHQASNAATNKFVLNALMGGIEGFTLNISSPDSTPQLLEGVEMPFIHPHFTCSPSNAAVLLKELQHIIHERGYQSSSMQGGLLIDPFSEALHIGSFAKADIDQWASHASAVTDQLPRFRGLLIDASFLHSCGASMHEEMGALLAMGHEIVVCLLDKGLSIDSITSLLHFKVSVGTQYLAEISKIKTIRSLWSAIVEQYEPKFECSSNVFVHAVTSDFHHTAQDHYNNILRDTSAAMAAAIGGADMITVTPFDSAAPTESRLKNRLGRNIQHMLREEAALDRMIDPVSGAYAFEAIMNQTAEKAWAFFQLLEKNGGFMKATEEGILQQHIINSATRKIDALNNGEAVVVGVNKYAQQDEKQPAIRNADSVKQSATNFEPLLPFRWTDRYSANPS